jgi:RNA polymerase sigma-70 factor, ECF subfamily
MVRSRRGKEAVVAIAKSSQEHAMSTGTRLLRASREAFAQKGVARIATNACLDALGRRPPRLLPIDVAPAGDPQLELLPPSELTWLDPYPDDVLAAAAPAEDEPQEAVVRKETIELAFLAAIQHLLPRRRAVLILRDVLGWSARDTASVLEMSVASVNSSLQRALATLRDHLPASRLE